MAVFRLTPAAKASLIQIAAFTEQRWGRKQRCAYIKQLDHCFHLLNRSPEIGRVRTEIASELRSHPSGSHIIYYLTKADHIVIVDILHQNMDPVRHLPSQQ